MKRALLVLSLLALTAGAQADTANVRQGGKQLTFRPVSGNASGGSTRPTYSEQHGLFRHLDIDGDGFVSKAEAAGNAPITVGFDRADRNRDGKLSFAEYDSIGKPPAARKKGSRSASASAGATKAKKN